MNKKKMDCIHFNKRKKIMADYEFEFVKLSIYGPKIILIVRENATN